jgi:hypothetical protein
MPEKIYLGKVKKEVVNTHCKGNEMHCLGQRIWIEKHSWDCGWYWGFGYIGNTRLHCHFDGQFLDGNVWLNPSKIFEETWLTEKIWWVLKDLFKQAYILRECAEVYRYGGHCTTVGGITDMLRDDEMCKRLNADLEKILNMIWTILETKKL